MNKKFICFLLMFVLLSCSFVSYAETGSNQVDALELAQWLYEQERMNMPSTMALDDEDYSDGSLRVQQLVLDGTNYKQLFSADWNNGVVSKLHVDVEHFYHTETWYDSVSVWRNDSTRMFNKGSKLSVDISNIVNYLYVDSVGQFNFKTSGINKVVLAIQNSNRSTSNQVITEFTASSYKGGVYSISFEFDDLPFDVYSMAVYVYYDLDDAYDGVSQYFNTKGVTRWGGFDNSYITLDEIKDDENNGLLKNIIQWLTDIRDKILNLPSLIWNAIKTGFNWIVDGLSNLGESILNGLISLGNFIIDGLKSLFIPADGFFEKYFDDFYDFYTKKLGFLVYPFELIADVISAYLNISEGSGRIEIPDFELFGTVFIKQTSYDLKGGLSSVLGEYYDVYYAFVDVVLLFAFIGFSKRKFDSVVGGH